MGLKSIGEGIWLVDVIRECENKIWIAEYVEERGIRVPDAFQHEPTSYCQSGYLWTCFSSALKDGGSIYYSCADFVVITDIVEIVILNYILFAKVIWYRATEEKKRKTKENSVLHRQKKVKWLLVIKTIQLRDQRMPEVKVLCIYSLIYWTYY